MWLIEWCLMISMPHFCLKSTFKFSLNVSILLSLNRIAVYKHIGWKLFFDFRRQPCAQAPLATATIQFWWCIFDSFAILSVNFSSLGRHTVLRSYLCWMVFLAFSPSFLYFLGDFSTFSIVSASLFVSKKSTKSPFTWCSMTSSTGGVFEPMTTASQLMASNRLQLNTKG